MICIIFLKKIKTHILINYYKINFLKLLKMNIIIRDIIENYFLNFKLTYKLFMINIQNLVVKGQMK